MADPPIKTIGVIGTGVIGSSWTLFFLSRGLNVIVSDPAPGARENLAAYLEYEWPTMQKMGLHEAASLGNYRFVDNVIDYLGDIDLVQEVRLLYSSRVLAAFLRAIRAFCTSSDTLSGGRKEGG
jgi:3-hydroxyacyl-CoA dehydrogenase